MIQHFWCVDWSPYSSQLYSSNKDHHLLCDETFWTVRYSNRTASLPIHAVWPILMARWGADTDKMMLSTMQINEISPIEVQHVTLNTYHNTVTGVILYFSSAASDWIHS